MYGNRMQVLDDELKLSGRVLRIAALAADTYEFIEDPEPTLLGLASRPERVDLFTFTESLGTASRRLPYHRELDNLAVIRITTFDDWWLNGIGFKARNKAKQAAKRGVTFRQAAFSDDLVRGIWAIYNETPIRQGKRYPHFGKDLATVHRMTNTFLDRSCFIGAYFQDRLIGFAKLHCDRSGSQAGLTHILSLIEHRDKAPTNALVAEAVRYCAEQRIPNLVYSRFSDGGKTHDSLMEFKERNGFQRVDLPRYFVPLTSLGKMALHLGLHRSVTTYLPQSAISAFRTLRKAWYTATAGEIRPVS